MHHCFGHISEESPHQRSGAAGGGIHTPLQQRGIVLKELHLPKSSRQVLQEQGIRLVPDSSHLSSPSFHSISEPEWSIVLPVLVLCFRHRLLFLKNKSENVIDDRQTPGH